MPAPRRRVPSDRRSRPALALGAWLVVVAAPALAGDAAPLPAAVVAKIEQKAVQLDEDRLKGLPAASRRGVLQTFVLSSFAQAADLPGFDENLLSPAQRAQADRVLADVLEGPPPAPTPTPTPTPAPPAPTPRPGPVPPSVVVPVSPAPVVFYVVPAPVTWAPVTPVWLVPPARPHPWLGWHRRPR